MHICLPLRAASHASRRRAHDRALRPLRLALRQLLLPTAAIAAIAWALAGATVVEAADTADVAVYHSAGDDGVRPTLIPSTPSSSPATLFLYMDSDSGQQTPSQQGLACEAGFGDERCGYDLVIETLGPVSLTGFVPEPGIVYSLTGTRLRLNGGDFFSGELGALRIGELSITSSGDGEVRVVGETVVDARLVGRSVRMKPVMLVPEPSSSALLVAGAIGLGALGRRRRRVDCRHGSKRRAGRQPWRADGRAALIALGVGAAILTLPNPASALWVFGVDVFAVRSVGPTLYYNAPCSGEFFPPTSVVRRVSGGSTEPGVGSDVYDPEVCDADRVASRNVDVNAGDTYWLNGSGEVVVKRYASASVDLVATLGVVPVNDVETVAVDALNVYWSEGASIYRAPKGGGARTAVVSHASQIQDLRVRGTRDLVYTSGGILYRTQFFGAPINAWTTSQLGNAVVYALQGSSIFWADPTAPGGGHFIRAWYGAAPATPIATVGAASGSIGAMAANASYVYFQTVVSAVGPIHRMEHDGSNLAPFTSSIGSLSSQQLDANDEFVFWVQNFNAIQRKLADSDPVLENLEAQALEVVQIVQRPANDVRLVANKPTHVRLWARIESSSIGRTSTRPWPMGIVRGFRGGMELPESPLYPMTPGGVGFLTDDAGYDRNSIAGQMLFRLPDGWTDAGDLELRGEINPTRAFSETDYVTDNEIVQTVTFHSKAALCVIVVPIDTAGGRYNSYRPRDAGTWLRARTLLPSDALPMSWPGGDPWQEYEDLFRRGTFELSRSDNDSWQLIGRMVLSEPFWGESPDCAAEGAKTHLLAIAPATLPNPAANGLALGNSSILWMRYGRDVTNSAQNSNVAGVSFAHELGHNDGRSHVDCAPGDPDGPDASFPYANSCTIDDDPTNGYTGFDPISLLPLPAATTSDLMGYGHRAPGGGIVRWPSAYTWDGIFDDIATPPTSFASPAMAASSGGLRAAAAPSGSGAPSAAMSVVPMQIGGLLDPKRPVATFAPAMPLLDTDSINRFIDLYGSLPLDPDLVLRVKDAAGAIIEDNPVIVLDESESPLEQPSLFVSFTNGVAPHARIELIDAAHPDRPLAVLTGGGAAPVVTIDAPLGGEVALGHLPAAWTATDADGDDLLSSVRLSADLGSTWRPVMWQSSEQGFDVSTVGLPTCVATCLLEVTVSDGAHATTVFSAPFSVLADPLEVSISLEEPGSTRVGTRLVMAQSSTAVLRGHAHSDDDGPLEGAALQWSVTGPSSLSGEGTSLRLQGLAPGTYAVTLDGLDSTGQAGSAAATLVVEPKKIAASGAPTVDGDCSDLAYQADDDAARIPYFGPESAFAQMIHNGTKTYVCISGLRSSAIGPGLAGLAVDLDSSGEIVPQSGDYEFRVDRDGVVTWGVGNGSSSFQLASPPAGLQADVDEQASTWSAELAIDDALLGGFGGTIRGQAFHRYPGVLGLPVQASWPEDSLDANPASWGEIELGVPARIVIDADAQREPNYIDPQDQGGLHVMAVLSTSEFDAVNDVDFGSVLFGPGLAAPVAGNAVDVNGDQLLDAVLAFQIGGIAASADDVELCLTGALLPAAGGGPFVACDDVIAECAPGVCDLDADGIADDADGCPLLADDGSDSGGLLTTVPDGIPDACQCGDWQADGVLDASDLDALRDSLAEKPVPPVPAATCDVTGDDRCDIVDVVFMARAQANMGPGLERTCAATQLE